MRQHTRNRSRWWRAAALTSTFALVAAACGDDSDDDTETDDESADTTEEAEEATAESNCPEGDAIQLGWIAWDEDIAVTHLWDALLTEQGYEVEQTQLDVGPIYTGLAEGDVDLFLDAWLPDTHSTYWEESGDNIEQLGVWNDSATLHITVPEYVDEDIQSLEDLADNADAFDSTIIGIEPDAGLMEATREGAIPTYGLDDWELTESGSPAMLAELDAAIENEENIVVTLWRPHWAYSAYELRDLEDPEGTLGEGENLEALACTGFSEENPEVAEWIGNFFLDSEQLNGLTNLVIEEHGSGEEAAAIEEWLSDDENRALADSWISGEGAEGAEGDDMSEDADAEGDDAEAEGDDMSEDDADAEGDDAEAEGDDMSDEENADEE